MSDETTVMVGEIPFQKSTNEVMAIIDGKLNDQIKQDVLKACPHIRGPVARIQFLTPSQTDESSVFFSETTKTAKVLMKSIKSDLKTMSQAYDALETKIERLMGDTQANDLIEQMVKEA